jgi:hypothetical protein
MPFTGLDTAAVFATLGSKKALFVAVKSNIALLLGLAVPIPTWANKLMVIKKTIPKNIFFIVL